MSEAFQDRRLPGGARIAAREAPREHGLVAGTLVGAWCILTQLEAWERQLKGERPLDAGAPPDPEPLLPVMALKAVELQTRAIRTIARIDVLLRARL